MSEDEKELIAYHEAGHALVSHLLPEASAMRKVTIIPRGMAGGVTWYLEDENKLYTTRRMKAIIATALGGRVAEELIFGDVTTGAQNDLMRITEIARSMVTQFGMGEGLSLRVYGKRQEMVFLGREISEQRDYSDAIAEQIDREVDQIITVQHELVRQLLSDNKGKLDLIAQTLLDVETLEAEEFAHLMEKGTLPPPPPAPPREANGRRPLRDPQRVTTPPNVDMPPAPSPA
jgi:cell division protease FtsH